MGEGMRIWYREGSYGRGEGGYSIGEEAMFAVDGAMVVRERATVLLFAFSCYVMLGFSYARGTRECKIIWRSLSPICSLPPYAPTTLIIYLTADRPADG